MKHDALCELSPTAITPSCRCGSRAYPLCEGCRDGLHLNHRPDDCSCDLCEVAA